MELVNQEGYGVTLVCKLFGHCRQAFYQSKTDIEQEKQIKSRIIAAVQEIRAEDPRIGSYKLWLMLISMFGRNAVPGRDSFFRILRRKGLMLPQPKARHTTNSNHRYHKWKNLVKGFIPLSSNQLWVSDITYIPLTNGEVCYLHLITDAYSHKIIGWNLADTLKATATLEALQMALNQAIEMRGEECLKKLIHHSDRGVQYCCDAYVEKLQSYGISISMTEDYKPTDNAIAERSNGIIKTECIYPQKLAETIEEANSMIASYIDFYNNKRPHMSIGYKVPSLVHCEQGEQEKKWKPKKYAKNESKCSEKTVHLPSRTNSLGEGLRQRT